MLQQICKMINLSFEEGPFLGGLLESKDIKAKGVHMLDFLNYILQYTVKIIEKSFLKCTSRSSESAVFCHLLPRFASVTP